MYHRIELTRHRFKTALGRGDEKIVEELRIILIVMLMFYALFFNDVIFSIIKNSQYTNVLQFGKSKGPTSKFKLFFNSVAPQFLFLKALQALLHTTYLL